MSPLERELEKDLLVRYELWKRHHYTAVYFKRMLTPGDRLYKGAVGTVKHLLGKSLGEKSGFIRLAKAGALDQTVESLITQPKWRPLFEEWEIQRARERLNSHRKG